MVDKYIFDIVQYLPFANHDWLLGVLSNNNNDKGGSEHFLDSAFIMSKNLPRGKTLNDFPCLILKRLAMNAELFDGFENFQVLDKIEFNFKLVELHNTPLV